MRIGVLALQGAFIEHIHVLNRLGAETVEIRMPKHLANCDGLVIPGGESTTIAKLLSEYRLLEPIRTLAKNGAPVMGTCAGMIVLARRVDALGYPTLDLIDITVARNAFGRQVDSFETDLTVPVLGSKPYHGVFIRAPLIARVGPGVEVLCQLGNGDVVAARQRNIVALAFHPELTDDARWHGYFLKLTAGVTLAESSC
jgi:5'-phosphate synthase pdxT subunit